jgi:RNA polymerase sigma-70 factor (ECF subfamily)
MAQDGTGAPSQDEIKELVRNAQAGDSASFAGLYEAFYGKIHRYVMFKTSNVTDAEDITEEVFLRMLESINSFKWQGYPFSSWLFRIAHNLVVDHYRKKGRQKTTPLEDANSMVGASTYDMDRQLDVDLSMKDVYEAMDGLTKLQKEVLSLRFAAGLSVLETAESLGKKENAIKALQHAAVKKLRNILGASGAATKDKVLPQWSR